MNNSITNMRYLIVIPPTECTVELEVVILATEYTVALRLRGRGAVVVERLWRRSKKKRKMVDVVLVPSVRGRPKWA